MAGLWRFAFERPAAFADVPPAPTGFRPAGLGLVATPDRTASRSSIITDKPKRLTDTARTLLTAAARRGEHLIQPPHLPIAAARQVVRSLLGSGLAEEVPASGEGADLDWTVGAGGGALVLRATAVGLARIADGEGILAVSVANEAIGEVAAPTDRRGDGLDAAHGPRVPRWSGQKGNHSRSR